LATTGIPIGLQIVFEQGASIRRERLKRRERHPFPDTDPRNTP